MSNNDSSGFGTFVPGFEFMQQMARQAAGGLAQSVVGASPLPQLPNLSTWVAPTFNVEELEKRINDLKAVHFWLDQNTRALSATIQALEVQKMTLSTLQSMNVSFTDVANALKTKATDSLSAFSGLHTAPPSPPAPSTEPTAPVTKASFAGLEIPPPLRASTSRPAADPPAPTNSTTAEPAPSATAASGIDPMLGWNALTQQFQTLAVNAMKEVSPQTVLEAGKHMASTLTREAMKTATDMTANLTRGLVPPTGTVTPDTAASAAPSAADTVSPIPRTPPSKRKVVSPSTATAPQRRTRTPSAQKPTANPVPDTPSPPPRRTRTGNTR